MKKGIVFFCVLMLLLLLTACGDGSSKTMQDITALYGATQGFDSRVSITVELPERTTVFVIDWQYAAGVHTMTVVEPEAIAGICAQSNDSGLSFTYQDSTLVVDAAGEGVSPIEVLPELLFGWSGGMVLDYSAEAFEEADALVLTYAQNRGAREYSQRVWFDTVRLTPLYAEFYNQESLSLVCRFLTFQIAR